MARLCGAARHSKSDGQEFCQVARVKRRTLQQVAAAHGQVEAVRRIPSSTARDDTVSATPELRGGISNVL